jgi:hypothetical protein
VAPASDVQGKPTVAHLVLLGDSIFDNASYVPPRAAVLDHLRARLGTTHRADLIAVDGATSRHLDEQLARLPADATHAALSVGGNDALQLASLMRTAVPDLGSALTRLGRELTPFRDAYRRTLHALTGRELQLLCCTVYDAIPDLDSAEVNGLRLFNDVIALESRRAGADLLELRLLCTEPADYSPVSPIEPSSQGGRKIAYALARWLETGTVA